MSKSNIALAVIAGAVIGGIVILALKAEDVILHTDADEENEKSSTRTEKIAGLFSRRIASDLEAAEYKFKSAVNKDPGFTKPRGEFGVFL